MLKQLRFFDRVQKDKHKNFFIHMQGFEGAAAAAGSVTADDSSSGEGGGVGGVEERVVAGTVKREEVCP